MISTIPQGNDGNMRRLLIAMNDAWQVEGIHLAQICCAQACSRSVPFQHRESVRCLRAVRDFHAFLLERLPQTLGKKHIAVNEQKLGTCATHGRTSVDIRCSRSSTSMISSPNDSNPKTYGGRLLVTGNGSASASSHSPVTGIAMRVAFPLTTRVTTR